MSGAKKTERWDKTEARNRDQELGFICAIYFGHVFLFLKLCSRQAQSRRIAMAFLCNNRITAARGNLFQNHSSKQGDLTQTVPCVHATGDAAGAGSWACRQKVCSHPYKMSHFIENNQSGRNNFLSFIRKFLLQHLAIPVLSLPGNTLDNSPSTMKYMCVAHFVELTLFWEHLLNI